jgi:hypothetical protein
MWVASDPDGVLLEGDILGQLRLKGFEVVPFEDSISFRADFEERFQQQWDRGERGAADSLILHVQDQNSDALPWDYLQISRKVSLSLATLLPRLSYSVVRQLDPVHRSALFDAHQRHATQPLGDSGTKEFVLLHVYRLSPHLITRTEDFWRELLRLNHRSDGLPAVFSAHMAQVLSDTSDFNVLPIADLFESRNAVLRCVQSAWGRFIEGHGLAGTGVAERSLIGANITIPFDHPDISALVDSMFLDGSLHPLVVQGAATNLPSWARVGVVQDPLAMRNLVAQGAGSLLADIPGSAASHKDWAQWSRRFGEMLYRFHALDTPRAESVRMQVHGLQANANQALIAWCADHYGDLPSLPVAKAPVMVHHIPRFLNARRQAGEARVALLVFDGLALDQWAVIRECVARRCPGVTFEEGTCFAWLPTLTSISRQALFSGLRPREFSDSIDTTASEPQHWSRFWQDQGLRSNEVAYRKGLKRTEQLDELSVLLENSTIKAVGLVVDTVDEIIHGAVLGKRGVARQIEDWCESGFVEQLFTRCIDQGFSVYVTADHGNVDAVGTGRPSQGVVAETRGERVRTYRSRTLLESTAAAWPGTVQLDVPGLPAGFSALYSSEKSAFLPAGEHAVVHGGISVEELIVPFVKVNVRP